MSIKKFVVIIFVLLTFVFSQQSFASLSTRVRICAVKGTVQTGPAVSGGHQGSLYTCPLKQTLDQTECRIVNVATMIETGHDGFAIVEYSDGSKIKIKPDTKLVISQSNIYVYEGKTWFKIEKRKNGELIIKTPTAIAGIRGTEFLVNVEGNGATNLQLIKGNIEVSDINHQSTVNLSTGMEVTVVPGSSVLNAKLLKINEDNKWWTNWPTLVPIAEKPGYGGVTGVTNGGQQIPASADAYVYAYAYRNWNRSNRGKQTSIAAGWHPNGGEQRAYLRFDLNNCSFNNTSRFILKLYYNHLGGSNAVDLGIYEVKSNWIEGRGTYPPSTPALPGELSWVNQPVTATYPVVTFNPGRQVPNWIEVDVTPLVKKWMTGSPNYGMVIKPTGNFTIKPAAQYGFMSREFEEINKRPQLLVSGQVTSTNSNFSNALGNPCGSNKEFIRSLYQSILDRDMEASFTPGHGGGYLRNLQNGDSRWKIIYSFFNSPEYKSKHKSHAAFIRDAYQAVLAREPKANEINAWPQIDRNTILIKFFNLEEYKKINNDCSNHKSIVNGASITGKWKWFTDVIVTISPDGTVRGSNGGKGIWSQSINNSQVEYVIKWTNGYADRLKLNGNTLKGKNQNGTTVWGNRIIPINNNNQTSENVWAINSANNIYKWNGGNWDVYPGKAQDIGVGANGTVWIVGKENNPYGGSIYRLEGSNFVKTPGQGVRIDVDPNGNPWGINNLGHIYKWQNNAWHRMPGRATDIGIGANGTVWVLGNKAVYGGFEIFRWTGSTFVKIPGAAVRIDVDPSGNPWVVNTFGVIYRLKNNSWEALPGRAKDISVGVKGSAWIIGTNSVAGGYGIYRWNEKRHNWDRIPGGATAISVGGMQAGNITSPVPGKFSNAVAFNHNILGQWKWFTGSVVTIYSDGKVKSSDGYSGTWAKNGSPNNIVIHWVENGAIDQLVLKGDNLNGKNQNGTVVSARKIITTNKSGGNTVQNTATLPKLFNHDIVGQWKWGSGSVVSIYPNGNVKSSDGNSGTWTIGSSTDAFIIHWIKGQNIDWLLLKADKLKGKNQKGAKVSAKKIIVDFKSGKYRVEQYIGSTYKSEWKIQVKKDKITGKSEWTCCPGRRIDPVRGYINGYTVVIERDCSGQNWNGTCRQKFIGTLMGSKIEGTCTGTGIVGTGRWVLFLK